MTQAHGTLYTVSAPSGAGKTSLVEALVEKDPLILLSVSHTTRAMRPNEQEGVNYHFVPSEEFVAMIGQHAFLEYAEVFGNHYGTSKHWVEQQLQAGKDVLLEIDWQGAEQIRSWANESGRSYTGIFILPPSMQALRDRLNDRGQDDSTVIDVRMQAAVDEISHYGAADYVIVNDSFDIALADLAAIFRAGRLQQIHQARRHEGLIAGLLGENPAQS